MAFLLRKLPTMLKPSDTHETKAVSDFPGQVMTVYGTMTGTVTLEVMLPEVPVTVTV